MPFTKWIYITLHCALLIMVNKLRQVVRLKEMNITKFCRLPLLRFRSRQTLFVCVVVHTETRSGPHRAAVYPAGIFSFETRRHRLTGRIREQTPCLQSPRGAPADPPPKDEKERQKERVKEDKTRERPRCHTTPPNYTTLFSSFLQSLSFCRQRPFE